MLNGFQPLKQYEGARHIRPTAFANSATTTVRAVPGRQTARHSSLLNIFAVATSSTHTSFKGNRMTLIMLPMTGKDGDLEEKIFPCETLR